MPPIGKDQNTARGDRTNSSLSTFPNAAQPGNMDTFLRGTIAAKSGPTDLREIIDATTEAGAQIFVQEKKGRIVAQTNKFYLTSFTLGSKEKTQLLETFGAPSVAFFGESARVYNFAGSALDYAGVKNSAQYYHQSSLLKMYHDVLRGSLLVERDQQAILMIANHTIFGYPLNIQVAYNSQADKLATFTMSWLVTDHRLTLPGIVKESDLTAMYSPSGDSSLVSQQIEAIIKPIQKLLYFDEYKARLNFASGFASLSNYTWETVAKVNIENAFVGNESTYFGFSDGVIKQLYPVFTVLVDAAKHGFSPIIAATLYSRNTPSAKEMTEALEGILSGLKNALGVKSFWNSSTGRIYNTNFENVKGPMSRLGALLRKLNLQKLIHRAQDAQKPLIGSY